MKADPRENADPRVQRTRASLREALIVLILERGWDALSVQDICGHAGVGRSTFYLHFADKEDLLVGGFEDLKKSLRVVRAASASPTALGFVRPLLEHVHENRRLFRALVGKRSGQLVQQRFRQVLVELVREDLGSRGGSAAEREPTARFLAGALFEMLIWWLEARQPLPMTSFEEVLRKLNAPVLGRLGREVLR